MSRYMWTVLSITVLVMSGTNNGAAFPGGARELKSVAVSYVLTIDVTNRVYNSSLLSSSSSDYQMLKTQVSGALYSIYGCNTCDPHSFYMGVTDMTFSDKSGSVLVEVTLAFSSEQINANIIKELFNRAIAGSKEINGIMFNPAFSQIDYQTTISPSTSTHSTTKHEGGHNAAFSFYQAPIMLTSFLRVSISIFLFFLML